MTRKILSLLGALLLLAGASMAMAAEAATNAGADIVEVFARALAGQPVRYVALGGSITQAGEGWIGPWLRQQFPQSAVTVVNSGMSATGSELGVHRVQRDVIDHQPDLVTIEYCVNDTGLTDEQATRYMESLIVRLKTLPNPPAILILEAAAEGGVKLARHRRLAQHYGLFEVDLQAAVDKHLREEKRPWSSLFSDEVHPTDAGHAFYASVMAQQLEPLVKQAGKPRSAKPAGALPKPLSTKPLILDGRMAPLTFAVAPGWKTLNPPGKWFDRFFMGTLVTSEPSAVLRLPFRGSRVALYYADDPTFGSFYVSVDGAQPVAVCTNTRGGYEYRTFAEDLAAREHVLTIAMPPAQQAALPLSFKGDVKLGYLMIAGESEASGELTPQGPWPAERIAALNLSPVPSGQFFWTIPSLPTGEKLSAQEFLKRPFPPEKATEQAEWKAMPAHPEPWQDLREATQTKDLSGVYVKTTLKSDSAREAIMGLAVDYYAKVWLNGQEVFALDTSHRQSKIPVLFPVRLEAGDNQVLIKIAPGGNGCGFCLMVEAPISR